MFTEYGHSIVGAYLHLQFTPAYRQDIFCDAVLIRLCRLEFQQVARRLGVTLEACAFGPDHTHLFLGGWKNYSIAYLAQMFKGVTSRYLRENCFERIKAKLWGKKFWSEGYFAETVGRITTKKMEYYISRQQEKHWKSQNYEIYLETHEKIEPQTNLTDYT